MNKVAWYYRIKPSFDCSAWYSHKTLLVARHKSRLWASLQDLDRSVSLAVYKPRVLVCVRHRRGLLAMPQLDVGDITAGSRSISCTSDQRRSRWFHRSRSSICRRWEPVSSTAADRRQVTARGDSWHFWALYLGLCRIIACHPASGSEKDKSTMQDMSTV